MGRTSQVLTDVVVEITPIDSLAQARQCVSIQRAVWGFAASDIVTEAMLLGCQRAGGIVLGARPPVQSLVGFVFSLPAPLGHRMIQHSHMLAVLPEYQDHGIGRQLKWAQFEQAHLQDCPRITWTYDPLEARNAFLNLNKLGARANRYYANLYGESTSSQLHQGIGTDRLLAEWVLDSPQTAPLGGRVTLEEALNMPQILPAEAGNRSLKPLAPDLNLSQNRLALEVPASIQQLKRTDLPLAQLWRQRSREAFRHYLGRGYQARGVMLTNDPANRLRRVFYCLERRDAPGHNPLRSRERPA